MIGLRDSRLQSASPAGKAKALTTISSIRFFRSSTGGFIRQATIAGLMVTMLGSCATTKKVADAGQAETAEEAVGMLAKGGTAMPGAQGTYVDPMVATAHGRKTSQKGMIAIAGGTPAQNALTQTYSPMPASIAGAVTEPTGVRAGNVSIFSGHGPAPEPTTATALTALDSPHPAASAMPSGGVNAMARSVFSTGAPVACGNDANGNMISCGFN